MSDNVKTQLAAIETERLDVHVAANYERFKHINDSLDRLENQQTKMHTDMKEDMGELKKVVVWASSTLFGTMLIALLTSVFKVI